MSMSVNPNSILKQDRKRPKTAERRSSRYNPNRGVSKGRSKKQQYDHSPMNSMAQGGVSFSPYAVPNVAKIPASSHKYEDSSSKRNVQFAGRKNELPTDMGGMNYLKSSIGQQRSASPLRDRSPRGKLGSRMQEMRASKNASPLASQGMSFTEQ
jgi:hypothetical protein